MKTLWQRLVERHRRVAEEVALIQLQMTKNGELKRPPLLFPQRPYKASTIVLFCVFGFFGVIAALVCFKEMLIPFFR